MLPPSALKLAAGEPGNVLSLSGAFVQIDQADYLLGHEKYIMDPWQGMLVKREINAVLEQIVRGMGDELGFAFDSRFGTDAENWTELNLMSAVRLIVAQGSSRFTVGAPLCRDEDYLQTTLEFPNRFMLTAGLVGLFPKFLRPLIGNLIWPYNFLLLKKHYALLKPLFEERLALLANPKSDNDPQDHLQMVSKALTLYTL